MKNSTLKFVLLLFAIGLGHAQQEKGIYGEENWLYNWTEFQPNKPDYGEPTVILTGTISKDTKLSKRETYLLLGSVIVGDSATLTIEPGTKILGDYDSKGSLTIARGSKILAEGLETDPIVFTSNKTLKRAGDWGGLMVLGAAPTSAYGNGSVSSYHDNLDQKAYKYLSYGGANDCDNSGILKYVRIEYAGKRTTDGYSNGLTLAGVGKDTKIQNVMVSYSAGDSFEILGGYFAMDKAVSYRSNGNDYHFNSGTQCTINNSLAVRSPYVSDRNGSRALVVKSYDKKDLFDFSKNLTSVTAKNLTLLNDSENLKSDIEMGLIIEGVYVGANSSLNMSKSVISGFNPAVIFQNSIKVNQENLERIKFTDMYFNNCNGNIFVENNSNNEDLENWYGNRAFLNVYSKGANTVTFINVKDERRLDYRLQINRIIGTNDVDIDDQ